MEWLKSQATLLNAIYALMGIAVIALVWSKGLFRFFFPEKKQEGPKFNLNDLIEKHVQLAGDNRDLTAQVSDLNSQLEDREQQNAQLSAAFEDLIARQSEPGVADALAHLKKGDTAQAIQIFKETAQKKEAEGNTSHKEAAEAWLHLGAIAFLGETQKALEAYENAIRLDPENPVGWNQFGRLKKRVGKIDEAESAFQAVLHLGGETENKELIAIAYGNLGLIYGSRGELEKAEKYLLTALALNEDLGRKAGMSIQYGNLGIIHNMRSDLDKAEEYHLKALVIDEELGRKEGMAIQYANLGNIHRARSDLNLAEEHYLKALAINEEVGNKEGMAADYGNLGLLEKDRNNMDAACGHWAEALELYKEIGIPDGISKTQRLMKEVGCKNTPS